MSDTDEHVYLVWSHDAQLWWKPDRAGYTTDVWQAGRYSWQEADRVCRSRSWPAEDRPPEVMVLAPEDGRSSIVVADLRGVAALMEQRVIDATKMARDKRAAGVR